MAEVSIRLSVRSSADDSLVTHGGRENDNIVCEQRQYEITRHLPLLGTKILFFLSRSPVDMVFESTRGEHLPKLEQRQRERGSHRSARPPWLIG